MLAGGPLQAVLINNKISNVCAGGAPGAGEAASEALCAGVGALLASQATTTAKSKAAKEGLSEGDANKAAAAAAIACTQMVTSASQQLDCFWRYYIIAPRILSTSRGIDHNCMCHVNLIPLGIAVLHGHHRLVASCQ